MKCFFLCALEIESVIATLSQSRKSYMCSQRDLSIRASVYQLCPQIERYSILLESDMKSDSECSP